METYYRIALAITVICISIGLSGVSSGQESAARNAKAWFDRGMLLQEAGKSDSTEAFKQAVKELDRTIESKDIDETGRAAAYSLRARCFNLLGENEQAIADVGKAIGLTPENADLYYLRSFIYEAMGNVQASLADLRTAAARGHVKARGELAVLERRQ